jgi:hypothetical protein
MPASYKISRTPTAERPAAPSDARCPTPCATLALSAPRRPSPPVYTCAWSASPATALSA